MPPTAEYTFFTLSRYTDLPQRIMGRKSGFVPEFVKLCHRNSVDKCTASELECRYLNGNCNRDFPGSFPIKWKCREDKTKLNMSSKEEEGRRGVGGGIPKLLRRLRLDGSSCNQDFKR